MTTRPQKNDKPPLEETLVECLDIYFQRLGEQKPHAVLAMVNEVIEKPYSKVTIELKEDFKLNDIKEILSDNGNTSINLIINKKNQKALYSLENTRKFDLNHFKILKDKEYVLKIIV